MRILRIAVAIGTVMALLVAPVSASPAPSRDSVSGVGIRLSAARVHYTVSVKGGAGTAGSFLYRNLDFRLTFGGQATCLDVDGNQAVVGGWITHTVGNPDLLGLGYLVFFEDNGDSGDLVSQTYIIPDDEGFIVGGVPADFPATCPAATVSRSDDPFEVQGNFVVVDR